jgi:hypothetical protein
MYQQKAMVVLDRVAKRTMPPPLRPARRHTHHALGDAIEQAELFANLFTWTGARDEDHMPRSTDALGE